MKYVFQALEISRIKRTGETACRWAQSLHQEGDAEGVETGIDKVLGSTERNECQKGSVNKKLQMPYINAGWRRPCVFRALRTRNSVLPKLGSSLVNAEELELCAIRA